MTQTATYELIGAPRIEREYTTDEYETVMVCDVRRSDGETGDVWICAGIRPQDVGTVKNCGHQTGFLHAWVFGDSPDMWCPASFSYDDAEAILDAVREAAIQTHRDRPGCYCAEE
jgi:hypothetical protein